MLDGKVSSSQMLADRLIAMGYVAMRVRSLAAGSDAGDINLVLWRWGTDPPALVTPVDDEGRLASSPGGSLSRRTPCRESRRASRKERSVSTASSRACWMYLSMSGPASSASVTKWTVQPCSDTPAASARSWVRRPGNAG